MAPTTPDNEDFDEAEAKALGLALKFLRKRAGKTLQDAADAFGVESGQAFSKYESGKAPSVFRPDTQRRLAAAVDSTPEEWKLVTRQLAGRPAAPSPTGMVEPARPFVGATDHLIVRDRVQAGAWLAADDTSQAEPARYPLARDPRYPHADQWLCSVVGDSMNMLGIFENDLVHCVDAVGIGYFPRTGDIVEVERLRDGGGWRELTIKQVEVTPDTVLLWPRSSNPRWTEPLSLTRDVRDAEEMEVRIRGLVLGATRRF